MLNLDESVTRITKVFILFVGASAHREPSGEQRINAYALVEILKRMISEIANLHNIVLSFSEAELLMHEFAKDLCAESSDWLRDVQSGSECTIGITESVNFTQALAKSAKRHFEIQKSGKFGPQ